MPLVEQDLLTFSENLSSSLDFSVVRVALVIKPDTSHELRKGQIVITTNGTYSWSFMT